MHHKEMLVLREQADPAPKKSADPAPKKSDSALEHLRVPNMMRGQELSAPQEKAHDVLGSSTCYCTKLFVEIYTPLLL